MYKHTTYKVGGGPARIYLKVKDVDSRLKQLNIVVSIGLNI